ncbi:MAG: type II 3-dehydroquinate dehydratase [Gammaproteobacteria bacterium]|nr:type II 3-dehydroquinate dehydratase [Gammaproteobacteria bacterium]MDH3449524.1 type II 3-dehydroquinate dehydratase [Gammaproteobacteria bacterium]
MTTILVLHGPNLNLLGTREPEVYGSDTLASINQRLGQMAEQNGVQLQTFQSNSEGEIVSRIQQAGAEQVDFIIINPAAYTHTSVAIRDAFLATRIPFIETHLSNVYAREEFRMNSYLSDLAIGVIGGFGKNSYLLAFEAAIIHCKQSVKKRAE